MQFYQIHLNSLPEIKYAQRAECTNYTNVYACIQDYFEIVLIDDADPMYVCYKDHTEQAEYGTFFTIVQSMDMQVEVLGRNVHHTVGVKAKYTETKYQSEKLSVQEILDILKNAKEEGYF